MKNVTIFTKIIFEKEINILDSQSCVDAISNIADILNDDRRLNLQKTVMPLLDNQELDAPVAIVHAANSFSVILSRGSIIVQSALHDNVDEDTICGELSKHMASIAIVNNIDRRLKAMSCSVSNDTQINSMEDAKEFLKKTEYSYLANSITGYGFNFQYFRIPDISGITSQSATYTLITNVKQQKTVIRSTLTMLMGGVNAENNSYDSNINLDYDNVREIFSKKNIKRMLKGNYGIISK